MEGSNRRLFLAGATGVIGVQLIPILRDRGFRLAGMTRSADKAPALEARSVTPVVCDIFDRDAVLTAVQEFAPDVVMHQLTDLPDDAAHLEDYFPANARIRTEGTRNLVDAAARAGATRFVAQSIAWQLPGSGGEAVAEHERMVLSVDGVVARYGRFYGPGTYHETGKPEPPAIHVADAATRTAELIDAPSGTYEVVDPK
jgi:nucleoside-diphosphate-sugar epimerase